VATTEKIRNRNNLCPVNLPDYLILLNVEPGKSFSIVKEASKFSVPSIAFCDSISDLAVFTY
jgi:ribosomal protein S2